LSVTDKDEAIIDLAVEHGRLPPYAILRIIQIRYEPDRVVVLNSAIEASMESEGFRQPRRLYDLLVRLVTNYVDALRRGQPDSEARHVLGNAYRANESETVQSVRERVRTRTFRYNGRDIAMFQHLGIGVAESVEDTIRVYFSWDPESGRVIVGYVGPHLPTR